MLALKARVEELDQLAPAQFILIVAAAGGIVRGMPSLLRPHTIAGVLSIVLLNNGAWIALWWLAVRRRRFSVLQTAWHVVAALALADTLAFGLSLALVSIDTHGEVARRIAQRPVVDLLGGFVPPLLLLGLLRFVGAAVLLSLGRLLPGGSQGGSDGPFPSVHHDAIT